MTENECIKELSYDNTAYGGKCSEEVRRVAIHALSEIQQYRAIGTVEEIQSIKDQLLMVKDMCKDYYEIGTIEEFKALKKNGFFNFDSPVVSVDEKSYNNAIDDVLEKALEWNKTAVRKYLMRLFILLQRN